MESGGFVRFLVVISIFWSLALLVILASFLLVLEDSWVISGVLVGSIRSPISVCQ